VLLAMVSLAVLYSNREQVGPIEAALLQQEQGGLYGSALFYRPYPYKLERYRLTRPDVAVLGSSRAMPFLAVGFAASEANLGGAITEIAEGERFVADILAVHKPKLVLFTLDYWWFNRARVERPSDGMTGAEIHFTLEHLIAPYRWLAKGEVRPSGLLQALVAGPAGPPRLGALANQSNAGFDVEGAYHYGDILTGRGEHPDRNFKSTLKRLKNGKKDGKFSANAAFSEEAWQGLLHIDTMLRQAGVEVRYLLPPVASVPYAEMQGLGAGLLTTLHDRLARSGVTFYDFTDPARLGSPDCEFEDGIHGGFVTALRMLRAIAPDLKTTPSLANLLKPAPELDRLITANAGRATLRDEAWSGREVDFLGLGCNKF
jgi:hypothetical protein